MRGAGGFERRAVGVARSGGWQACFGSPVEQIPAIYAAVGRTASTWGPATRPNTSISATRWSVARSGSIRARKPFGKLVQRLAVSSGTYVDWAWVKQRFKCFGVVFSMVRQLSDWNKGSRLPDRRLAD